MQRCGQGTYSVILSGHRGAALIKLPMVPLHARIRAMPASWRTWVIHLYLCYEFKQRAHILLRGSYPDGDMGLVQLVSSFTSPQT